MNSSAYLSNNKGLKTSHSKNKSISYLALALPVKNNYMSVVTHLTSVNDENEGLINN